MHDIPFRTIVAAIRNCPLNMSSTLVGHSQICSWRGQGEPPHGLCKGFLGDDHGGAKGAYVVDTVRLSEREALEN